MRQYIYQSSVIGLPEWPSGTLRFPTMEVTTDPSEADVFVVPGNLGMFERPRGSGALDHDLLYRLPYFRGNEARTVFFDVSDDFKQPINLPIIFIRCDQRSWMQERDPNTIQMAWPVTDFIECIDVPEGGFKFDITSHQWDSSETRIQAAISCQQDKTLKSDIIRRDHFTGYVGTPGHALYDPVEFDRRMADYKRSLKESRIALCGESIPGVFPYRYFEALSAGRVPLLVGSDFVFPFEKEIPYKRFTLFCPRNEASRANQIAGAFLRSHSDSEILEMGREGRRYWERWLDSRKWPELHQYAVVKQLNKMGATVACG